MKNIGVISITKNSMPSINSKLGSINNLSVKNYLDEGIHQMIKNENGVTNKSIMRMAQIIEKASQDGADIILLTCTVFTPKIDILQSLFDLPILAIDDPMMENAAIINKKTAILCTFKASIKTSEDVFIKHSTAHKFGNKPDMFLLSDALLEIEKGNKEIHDKIIAEKVYELSDRYEVIILAQLSMTDSLKLLQKTDAIVLNSLDSICEKIDGIVNE